MRRADPDAPPVDRTPPGRAPALSQWFYEVSVALREEQAEINRAGGFIDKGARPTPRAMRMPPLRRDMAAGAEAEFDQERA